MRRWCRVHACRAQLRHIRHKDYAPRTLSGAWIVASKRTGVISTPGQFAVREARLSLERGLNVMVFSDNIPVEDEVRLKELATKLGLLMMGPGLRDRVPARHAYRLRQCGSPRFCRGGVRFGYWAEARPARPGRRWPVTWNRRRGGGI